MYIKVRQTSMKAGRSAYIDSEDNSESNDIIKIQPICCPSRYYTLDRVSTNMTSSCWLTMKSREYVCP